MFETVAIYQRRRVRRLYIFNVSRTRSQNARTYEYFRKSRKIIELRTFRVIRRTNVGRSARDENGFTLNSAREKLPCRRC